MKKQISPGDNVSFKTSKYENEDIITWLNSQSNVTDSIRYLIEQDISNYGLRNLQESIPAKRFVSPARREPAEIQVASQPAIQRPERPARVIEAPRSVTREADPTIKRPDDISKTNTAAADPEQGQKPDRNKNPDKVTEDDIQSWE